MASSCGNMARWHDLAIPCPQVSRWRVTQWNLAEKKVPKSPAVVPQRSECFWKCSFPFLISQSTTQGSVHWRHDSCGDQSSLAQQLWQLRALIDTNLITGSCKVKAGLWWGIVKISSTRNPEVRSSPEVLSRTLWDASSQKCQNCESNVHNIKLKCICGLQFSEHLQGSEGRVKSVEQWKISSRFCDQCSSTYCHIHRLVPLFAVNSRSVQTEPSLTCDPRESGLHSVFQLSQPEVRGPEVVPNFSPGTVCSRTGTELSVSGELRDNWNSCFRF